MSAQIGHPGLPVVMCDSLKDGEVIAAIDPAHEVMPTMCLMIGTRPLTDVEMAGLEGRWIVRRGLADVLAYIGEEIGSPPRRSGRGHELYQAFRNRATTPTTPADMTPAETQETSE